MSVTKSCKGACLRLTTITPNKTERVLSSYIDRVRNHPHTHQQRGRAGGGVRQAPNHVKTASTKQHAFRRFRYVTASWSCISLWRGRTLMLEDDSEAISGTKRRSHVMACGESTDHTRDAHTHIHKTKTKPKFRSEQRPTACSTIHLLSECYPTTQSFWRFECIYNVEVWRKDRERWQYWVHMKLCVSHAIIPNHAHVPWLIGSTIMIRQN